MCERGSCSSACSDRRVRRKLGVEAELLAMMTLFPSEQRELPTVAEDSAQLHAYAVLSAVNSKQTSH